MSQAVNTDLKINKPLHVPFSNTAGIWALEKKKESALSLTRKKQSGLAKPLECPSRSTGLAAARGIPAGSPGSVCPAIHG